MNKSRYFLALACFLPALLPLHAQVLIAPVGGFGASSSGSLSWSMGELVIANSQAGKSERFLLQGFQQPNKPTDKVDPDGIFPEVIIADGVTPNNGDGKNDELVIEGAEKYPNYIFVVYNRWGNEVHRSSAQNRRNPINPHSWDITATSQGGKDKVPPGAYYYIFTSGVEGHKPKTGVINVVY